MSKVLNGTTDAKIEALFLREVEFGIFPCGIPRSRTLPPAFVKFPAELTSPDPLPPFSEC